MKTTFTCVAGVIALVSGIGAGRAVAQQGGPPIRQTSSTQPPASAAQPMASALPGTRVGVVNINMVLKEYKKAQALNNAIKQDVTQYGQQLEKLKKQMTDLQGEMAKPQTTPPQKEQIEKQIRNLQFQLQDLDNEARKNIGKKQGEIAVQIFKEVEGVIRAVATSNGFDLVLSYPDSTDPNDAYSQDNVVRKLAAQAAMPLFHKPHIDLTDAVIKTLNASYPPPAAAAAAAPTGR